MNKVRRSVVEDHDLGTSPQNPLEIAFDRGAQAVEFTGRGGSQENTDINIAFRMVGTSRDAAKEIGGNQLVVRRYQHLRHRPNDLLPVHTPIISGPGRSGRWTTASPTQVEAVPGGKARGISCFLRPPFRHSGCWAYDSQHREMCRDETGSRSRNKDPPDA